MGQLAPLENNDRVAIFQFYVGSGVGCMVTSYKSRLVKTLSTWNKILTHPDRGIFFFVELISHFKIVTSTIVQIKNIKRIANAVHALSSPFIIQSPMSERVQKVQRQN